jgi:hypothetical protein
MKVSQVIPKSTESESIYPAAVVPGDERHPQMEDMTPLISRFDSTECLMCASLIVSRFIRPPGIGILREIPVDPLVKKM